MIKLFGFVFKASGSLMLEKHSETESLIPAFETEEGAEKYLATNIDSRYRSIIELSEIDNDLLRKTKEGNQELHGIYIDVRSSWNTGSGLAS